MKRIFVILLFFISLSITAEELHYLTDDIMDIRNKVWYYGTNSFNEIDDFKLRFKNQFVKKIIITDKFSSLSGENFTICKNLLFRGELLSSVPLATCMIQIICDENYGVLLYFWNDTSSFGNFRDTGIKLITRYFFEIK